MVKKLDQRGIALLIALTVILVLSIIAGAIVFRSVSENNNTRKYMESLQAFWLADSAVGRGLVELRNSTSTSGSGIFETSLGNGRYCLDIPSGASWPKTVTARGWIPDGSRANARVERIIEVVMNKLPVTPSNFYDNAIYCAGNVLVTGNSYDVDGTVRYAGNIVGDHPERIDDPVRDATINNPFARLDFSQLRSISQSQGNYHSAALGNLTGPFPTSFWKDEAAGIPNVVFIEGSLDLSGKKGQVGGFYVVGGEFVYDASISGNAGIAGAVYTLGNFSIIGGGNTLNINGGVWAGGNVSLTGNAKVEYNATYMDAIANLNIVTTVDITSWRDTQNPYKLSP